MKKMVAKKAPKKYAMGGMMTTTTETTKKPGVKVVQKKTTVVPPKKKVNTNNDVQMYKIKGKILSGEGFDAMDQKYNMLNKNGGKVKKAANGTSLGMKSVKSGYDNNSGVTRADFVAIGKGTAKSGKTIKKGQNSNIMRPVGLNIGSTMQEQLRKEKMDREKANAKNPPSSTSSSKRPDSSMSNPYSTSGVNPATLAKSGKTMRKAKSGSALKKQAATAIAMKKAGKTPKAMMKSGGKMTKCKYGCK
jgi:hypothetical protein